MTISIANGGWCQWDNQLRIFQRASWVRISAHQWAALAFILGARGRRNARSGSGFGAA